MKYEIGKQTVAAIYDNSGTRNPLIEALPESLGQEEFFQNICSLPPVSKERLTPTERTRALSLIPTLFVPLDYMYGVYESLFRMLRSSYYTMTSRESVTRINALFATDSVGYGTQTQSGALLGTPGLGKTTTIKRCLNLMPQVIAHERYLRKPFYTKQVLWLFVECPSDASAKTMAFNIVRALDMAVGGNHLDYLMHTRYSAVSSVVTYIKILCVTYHVGLLVIDEIQNVVTTAKKTNRVKPLIRFLTELTNDTCTAAYFAGTTVADTVFQSEEYLRRRTRGPRLLPFKPDGMYRSFLESIWSYQFTRNKAELTDKLANQIYDYSGGIPAYITKLFEEAQAQALLQDTPSIEGKLIIQAANYLSIQPPKELGRGTFISDIHLSVNNSVNAEGDVVSVANEDEESMRLYANRRGRKVMKRDAEDLIVAYKEQHIIDVLRGFDLLEERVIC